MDNFIRSAKLWTPKTSAHFRNACGFFGRFDKFRIRIFIFPIHILCCCAPIRTGTVGTKIQSATVTPRNNLLSVQFVPQTGKLLLCGTDRAFFRLVPTNSKPIFVFLCCDRKDSAETVRVHHHFNRFVRIFATDLHNCLFFMFREPARSVGLFP